MKVFFVIVGACLLGAFTCWKSVASDTDAGDDFFLKNVEALADEEFLGTTSCIYSGKYKCPINGEEVGLVYEGDGLTPDEETY